MVSALLVLLCWRWCRCRFRWQLRKLRYLCQYRLR